jgi:hypothetical protein
LLPALDAYWSPREIHQAVLQAVRLRQSSTWRLMQMLRVFKNRRGWSALGFDSLSHYSRERLQISSSLIKMLIALHDRLNALPHLRNAFESSRLHLTQTELLTRVANPENEQRLIELAGKVVVKRLRELVDQALERRSTHHMIAALQRWVELGRVGKPRQQQTERIASELSVHTCAPEQPPLNSNEAATAGHRSQTCAAEQPPLSYYSAAVPAAVGNRGQTWAAEQPPLSSRSAAVPAVVGHPGPACAADQLPLSSHSAAVPAVVGHRGQTCAPFDGPPLPPAPPIRDILRAVTDPERFGHILGDDRLPATSDNLVPFSFYLPAELEEIWLIVEASLGLDWGPSPPIHRRLQVLVDHYLEEHAAEGLESIRNHPIVERDGWRCAVPGCSSRRNLHVHHIVFRARGGTEYKTNKITLCEVHHRHGIHAGRIRLRGLAPDHLLWQLGLDPELGPLLTVHDGWLVPEVVDEHEVMEVLPCHA